MVHASSERVLQVLTEVGRWPEWTPSMSRVELLGSGPLQVGSRVRIKQPRLPSVVWQVSDLGSDGFSWTNSAAGVASFADHRLSEDADGIRVRLLLRQHGPLALLLGALTAGLTRRYLRMEADGLKRRSEGTD